MNALIKEIKKPSKDERAIAMKSYNALASSLKQLSSNNPEIEIQETQEKIRLPLKALKLLETILRTISEGQSVSIIAGASEVTTQVAAEMLGCSRPYFVQLLEDGKIAFTKVGRHRRIKIDDVLIYKEQMKVSRKSVLLEIIKSDEELGLYDS